MNSQNNQGDHYVVDGAIFKCKYGNTPCQIAVTTNQKVKAQGKAVVTDKEVNFKVPACTFGNCSMNPNKQAPVCNYANGMWISNTTLKHGTNNAVTESSKMKCPIYSGEISCVYHGQTQCVSIDDFKCLGLEKLAFSPFATVLKFPDDDKAKKKISPVNSVSVSREIIRPNDIVTLHAFKKGNKELTATEFCNWIVTTRKSVNDGGNDKSCHLDKMTIYKTVTSPFNIILNEPGIYHLECGSDNMISYYAGSKSFVPTNTKKTTFDYKKSIGVNNELPFDKNCETIIEVLEHNRILDIELKGEYTVDSQNVSRYFVEKNKEIEIIVTTAVPLIKNERLCLVVNGIQTTNQASPIEDNKYSFKFKTSGFNSHIEKRIDIILKDYTDITSYQIPFNCNLSKSRENEESNCKSLTIKVIDGYVSATISLDEKGERPVKDKIRPNTPIFMAVRPTDKSCSIKDLNKAVWKIKENGITSNFHGNFLWHNFKREGEVKITVDLSSCDVAIKDNKLTHSFTVARNKITGIKKSTPKIFFPNINYRIGLDFLYDDYDKIEDGTFSYLLDGEEKEIDSKEINVIFSKEELGKHYLFISKDVALDLDVKEAQIDRWQFVDNNRNKVSEVGFDEPFFLDIDVPAWKDLNKKELTDQVRFCLWDKKSPIKASCLENARIDQNGQAHIKLIISKDDVNVGKREKINIIASLINPPYTDLKNLSQMQGQNGHWICSNMPISDQISTTFTLISTPCITGYFSGKSCNPQKSVMKYGDSIYIILSTHNCKEMMDKITVELYENDKVDDDTLIATYDNLQADEYGKVKIDISDKFADEESHGNNPNPRLFYFRVRLGAVVVYSYPQTQEDVFNMTYRKECDECNTAVVEFDGETHTVTTSDSKAVTKVRSYLWQLKIGKDKQISELNKTLAMMAPVVVGEELRKGERGNGENQCPRCHEEAEDMIDRVKKSGVFKENAYPNIETICKTYCQYMEKLKMDTCWIKAHFFAQISVESGDGLNPRPENLNYSLSGLTSTFPSQIYKNGKDGDYKEGVESALKDIFDDTKTKPGIDRCKKIAGLVYGPNNKDLGNESEEEGWKYRGGGYIQITGKSNYNKIEKLMKSIYEGEKKIDLTNGADELVNDVELSTLASMIYLFSHNIHGLYVANGNDSTNFVNKKVGKKFIPKGSTESNYQKKQKNFDNLKKAFEVDKCECDKKVLDSEENKNVYTIDLDTFGIDFKKADSQDYVYNLKHEGKTVRTFLFTAIQITKNWVDRYKNKQSTTSWMFPFPETNEKAEKQAVEKDSSYTKLPKWGRYSVRDDGGDNWASPQCCAALLGLFYSLPLHENEYNGYIYFNDITTYSPDIHQTHKEGNEIDIRYPGSSNKTGDINWDEIVKNRYNGKESDFISFLETFLAFADKWGFRSNNANKSVKGAKYCDNHDHHLHLGYNPSRKSNFK